MSRRTRRTGAATAVLAATLAAGRDAAAQCALCGQAAAAAGDPEQASRTFAAAILTLLIPALVMLAAAGFLLWKFRGDPAADLDQP